MITHSRRQNYRIFHCEVCNKTFRSSRQHVRTCSPSCRKKLSRAGQKKKERKNENVTGVTFQQLEMLLVKYENGEIQNS